MDELFSHVSAHGGVCRSSALYAAGFTQRELRRAVEAGMLLRPLRGWVALSNADPELRFAAEQGVVLSCVTQARRLGLWVLEGGGRRHLAAPPGIHVRGSPGKVHWDRPLVPRRPWILEDRVENVLHLVARCLPREAALTVLESALNRGLVTLPGLEALPLRQDLRALVRHATPFSDSGLESLFRDRLKWLRIPIRSQSHVTGRRVDLLIGERLVVQIDGGAHVDRRREADILHDAIALLDGYHVLRFGYFQVIRSWERVESLVLGAIARDLHRNRAS